MAEDEVPLELMPADGASDPRLQRALEDIGRVLVDGERIEAYAVQHRCVALAARRSVVVATGGRLIFVARHLFGGFSFTDVRWQDLHDASVTVGAFSASLIVRAGPASDLATAGPRRITVVRHAHGLEKVQAQALYRISQAHEQAWREKRRIRELEELRAKSGSVQVGIAGAPPPQNGDNAMVRLERAKLMAAKGLISDSEFEALKARLLAEL